MKATTTTTTALLLLSAALAFARCDDGPCDDPAVLNLETTECQKYHILSARGSTAPIPGHAGELIRQVCEGLGGIKACGYENLDYPAANGDAWCESAHTGALKGQQQLANYTERCPDAKIIAIGFSQGASVTLDYIGGGGGVDVFGCHQEENEGLDRTSSPGSHIVAAAVFGPTVHAAGQNYTLKGGDKYNGTATRSEGHVAGLAPYASILQEYCNTGDFICAKGSPDSKLEYHLNYFQKYTEEAAKFIIETSKKGKVGQASVGQTNTNLNTNTNTNTSTSTNNSTNTNTNTSENNDTSDNDDGQASTSGANSTSAASPALSARTTLALGTILLGTLFL